MYYLNFLSTHQLLQQIFLIAERERKLPCAKGSLSPNPHPWQNKRPYKITSPNGCFAKNSLNYDAVSARYILKLTFSEMVFICLTNKQTTFILSFFLGFFLKL